MSNQTINVSTLLKNTIMTVVPEIENIGSEISSDTPLYELGIESIGIFEMAGYIEDELDIELANEELSQMVTVGDIEKIIQDKIA